MADQVYVVTTTEYASEEYSPACDETTSSRWIEKEEVGKCRLNLVGDRCHVFVSRWVKEESRLMVAKQLYEEASWNG